jgi:hypothetical protein
VVLLAALVGWASAPGPRPKGAVLVKPTGPAVAERHAVDWRQVLTKLDLARSAVFEQPDSIGFDGVDVPGSQAYRYDAAAAASLRAHGAHAVGLRLVLESVRTESATTRRVTLRVTDRRLPYEIRDSQGRVESRVAGRGAAAHVIELDASGAAGAWRFVSISDPAVTS